VEPDFRLVRLSVRPVCRPKFGSTKAGASRTASSSFEPRPKFLHRPKRLRCHSASAGAATQQIAPPTRDPAGRGPTDARHSRHARSRSHQGHHAATVTTESLQAAGKLPCATTLSSLDAAVVTRRRHRVTSFAFPSGGAPAGASLHLRLPLRRRRPGAEYADCIYGTDCADCGLRFPRPPPICAETCNWASDADCNDCSPGSEFRPAPGRARQVDRTIVTCGIVRRQCMYMYMSCTRLRLEN
jgi:hypothetical protein